MEAEEILNAVIRAAEITAAQASGNDKTDWENFADVLRETREKLQSQPKSKPPKT